MQNKLTIKESVLLFCTMNHKNSKLETNLKDKVRTKIGIKGYESLQACDASRMKVKW